VIRGDDDNDDDDDDDDGNNAQTGTPIQPPTQRVPGALSLGVKRPEREADHSPPSGPKSRMSGVIPPLPNMPL